MNMSINGFVKRNVYWLKDYFNGGKVKYFWNDLEKVLSDKETGLQIQNAHLYNILNHAVDNTMLL